MYGNSIKNTFKTSDLKFKNDKGLIGCSASHNGYEKNFNCIHKREVYLDQNNNKLNGVDHILKKKDGIPIRYVLRFHLNPELSAVKTISGSSALIQISKNNKRTYLGTVSKGLIKKKAKVIVYPNQEINEIKSINFYKKKLNFANTDMPISITFKIVSLFKSAASN